MNRREAKHQVCSAVALILDNGSENAFLYEGATGELPASDQDRMLEAFKELVGELHRRGEAREKGRGKR